ncbi:MAG TPA: hypothetical protein VF834_08125 [Streptosporangiaceae bacterium]
MQTTGDADVAGADGLAGDVAGWVVWLVLPLGGVVVLEHAAVMAAAQTATVIQMRVDRGECCWSMVPPVL